MEIFQPPFPEPSRQGHELGIGHRTGRQVVATNKRGVKPEGHREIPCQWCWPFCNQRWMEHILAEKASMVMHALDFSASQKRWWFGWDSGPRPQDEEALAQSSTAFPRSYCWHSEILDESGIELKYLLRNLESVMDNGTEIFVCVCVFLFCTTLFGYPQNRRTPLWTSIST